MTQPSIRESIAMLPAHLQNLDFRPREKRGPHVRIWRCFICGSVRRGCRHREPEVLEFLDGASVRIVKRLIRDITEMRLGNSALCYQVPVAGAETSPGSHASGKR